MDGIRYRDASELKESRKPWVGKMPAGWEISRLKYLMFLNPIDHYHNGNFECSFIPMNRLHEGYHDTDLTVSYNEYSQGYTSFREDDVLMAKVTPCFENRNIAIARNLCNKAGVGSTEINVFRAQKINRNFLFYRLLESHFMRFAVSNMYGVAGLKRVPPDYFLNYQLFIPQIVEQRQIANFLDIKTAQFDSIIAKKEQLINKLEEAKKSLISEVVSGKVKIVDGHLVQRQSEEMKDSGVEWIGRVPRDWKIKKSKYVLSIFGSSESDDEINTDGNGINYYKVDDLNTEGRVIVSSKYFVNKIGINGPLILIPKRGAAISTNKVKVVKTSCLFDSNLMGLRINSNFSIIYYMYCLSSRGLWDIADISTVPQINNKHIYPLVVPAPEKTIQDDIVGFLDVEINKINKITDNYINQISILKSAKQSLISEAVTGKIDLRDWAIIEQGGAS